jgi:hypothetical protein
MEEGVGILGNQTRWQGRVSIRIGKQGEEPCGPTRHSDWGKKDEEWRRDRAPAAGGPRAGRLGLIMCSRSPA